LLALLVLAAIAVALAPEGRSPTHPRPAYRPQHRSIPASARRQFTAATAGVFLRFAAFGLPAGLAGAFLAGFLHHPSPALAGLTIFATFGTGVIVQTTTASWPAHRLIAAGMMPTLIGLGVIVASAWTSPPSLAPFLIGGVIVGAGGGAIFRGSLTVVISTSDPDDRAAALASFFTAGFIGLSVPVVGLGVALQHLSPRVTLLIFGVLSASESSPPRPSLSDHLTPVQAKRLAVGTTNTNASDNGRGSESWSWSWTHFNVDRRSARYCRVTFDHPPINTITATTVAELTELVSLIEQDPDLNVIVFDSANPDFYLAHHDLRPGPSRTAALGHGPTGMPAWLDLLVCLSRAPVVSIASIRGRARGAGSEFVLACDLRFASRENTLLGQFEVGMGMVPAGGAMARLARLVGRGRALESLLVADDLDGPRAEQYGYVNRLIADDKLDDEVDAIASRLARFDHEAIARTKSYVDRPTLPAESELVSAEADSRELSTRPAQQARLARLEALGLNADSDLERNLGRRVVDTPSEP
jgi:enoyl-CoA hydratase/carnithine racemase